MRNKFGLLLSLFLFSTAKAVEFQDAIRAANEGDLETATELLSPLAKNGHAGAQFLMGTLIEEEKGIEFAAAFYQSAAEGGFASAQYRLGLMYETGETSTPDKKRARYWYFKASKQNNVDAQYRLGRLLITEGKYKNDPQFVINLLSEPASVGHIDAQYQLGLVHDLVWGDVVTAIKWYSLSAKQGSPSGQFAMGLKYDLGHGVLQDYSAAKHWYLAAAEQGNVKAQANLGTLYAAEKSILQSQLKAYMWLNLAAASGSKVGAENRKMLIDELNAEQIDLAQKMSRDCKTKNYRGC